MNEAQLVMPDNTMLVTKPFYSQCKPDQYNQSANIDSKHHLDPKNIRLLNWNIYKSKRKNLEKDLHDFIKNGDIVTVQEAHLNDKLKSVFAEHNYQWTLNAAFHIDDRPSGVMTASRVNSLSTCGMRHIEPLIRTPKTILINYYPIKGQDKTLLVANIHGINFTLGTSAYEQQIKHLFEMTINHKGPVLIAGDFNTWSQTRMNIVDSHAKSADLLSLNYTKHNRTHFFGNALDHVYFRGLEAKTHQSWHVDSSDHNPISVNFRLL